MSIEVDNGWAGRSWRSRSLLKLKISVVKILDGILAEDHVILSISHMHLTDRSSLIYRASDAGSKRFATPDVDQPAGEPTNRQRGRDNIGSYRVVTEVSSA